MLLFFVLILFSIHAQPVKFTSNSSVTFISQNGVDTLKYPLTGGLNAPQFNTIDFNRDGIKDLVIFERIGNRLLTFIRTTNGYLYEPTYEKDFPPLNNWVILKDYNCDGLEDIFTEVNTSAQPDKTKPIFTQGIRLIKNKGIINGKFSWEQTQNQLYDTGIFNLPPTNIAVGNIDLPGIEDIDNDGDLDLLFFPLGRNVVNYYQNMSKELGYGCDSIKYVFRDDAWGYMYYLVNQHGFILHDTNTWTRNYPQLHGMHNGASLKFYDADNDGDKDLIYGDVGYNSLIFLKNAKTINSLNRDSIIFQDLNFPSNSVKAEIPIFPAAYIFNADNDTISDLIVCPNAESGAKNNNQILFYKNTGSNKNPVFTYQSNNYFVKDMVDLGGGAAPEFVDIDADNDLDLVIATNGEYSITQNSNDRLVLYKNIGSASKPVYQLTDTNFLNINSGLNKIFRIKASFGDLNNDGKADMVIGDLNGILHYYTNTSSGNNISFTKITGKLDLLNPGTFAAPQIIDFNKDGKKDLIIGRKNGTIVYYQNNGTLQDPVFTANPTIDSLGKVNVAQTFTSGGTTFYFDGYSNPYVCDIDKDGTFEMLVGSDQGKVFLYTNVSDNPSAVFNLLTDVFNYAEDENAVSVNMGNRCTVSLANLTNDSIPDILVGNACGGLRMYKTKIYGKISAINNPIISKNYALQLFPNPTCTNVWVNFNNVINSVNYSIYNINGTLVTTGKINPTNNLINLELLNNGIYFVTLNNQISVNETHKLIIYK